MGTGCCGCKCAEGRSPVPAAISVPDRAASVSIDPILDRPFSQAPAVEPLSLLTFYLLLAALAYPFVAWAQRRRTWLSLRIDLSRDADEKPPRKLPRRAGERRFIPAGVPLELEPVWVRT